MNAGNRNKPPPFPAKLLTGAPAISVLLMFGLVWSAYRSYRKVDTVQLQSSRIKELQGIIVHPDEMLTSESGSTDAADLKLVELDMRKEPA